ncbi:MAG: AgmX/PglI C-terminal domain-containing protein [Deltaproteobacteria bacterium]|nr:AgmX/PglI C-terminal domain-containing protein [Deltaproteobacteria bacterium]
MSSRWLPIVLLVAACGGGQNEPPAAQPAAKPAAQPAAAEPGAEAPAEPAGEPKAIPVEGAAKENASHINSTIASRKAEVRACYQRELAKNLKLRGKVVVHFSIGQDGKVVSASNTHDQIGQVVADCVTEVIKTLEFDVVDVDGNEVKVSYPFLFQSAE